MRRPDLTFLATLLLVVWGTATASWSAQPNENGPLNDRFLTAVTLQPDVMLRPASLHLATMDSGEPKISGESAGRTIWYRYTATKTGRAVIALATLDPSNSPLQAVVYRGGGLQSLQKVASVEIAGVPPADSRGGLAFDTVVGTTYQIQLDTTDSSGLANFFIGLQQFDPGGGLGVFRTRSLFFARRYSNFPHILIVVNGYRAAVQISMALPSVQRYFFTRITGEYLEVGGAAAVSLANDIVKDTRWTWPFKPVHDFSVNITATAVVGGAVLTTVKIPAYFMKENDPNPGIIIGRPKHSFLGVRSGWPVLDRITVKNTSSTGGDVYCIFVQQRERDSIQGKHLSQIAFAEVVNPPAVPYVNRPFPLAPGQVRTFDYMYSMSSNNSYEANRDGLLAILLYCPSRGGRGPWVQYHPSAGLRSVPQYGPMAQVRMDVKGTNALNELALPVNTKGRKILIKLTNSGEYQGLFRVFADDSVYGQVANVRSICEATDSGLCVGAAKERTVTVQLGRGAVTHVAVTVDRGSKTSMGVIGVTVDALNGPATSPTFRAKASRTDIVLVTP